jgi:hypothetical protein
MIKHALYDEVPELVIDETNFDSFFFDVRKHEPKQGQIIARYTTTAEFIDGPEKRNVIDLLTKTYKMIPTTQVMLKLLHTTELDSYRVPLAMARDMVEGLNVNEVAAKPYKYTAEMYFYTEKKYVPRDDPHWSIISILNLDEFLDKKDSWIKSRILDPEEVSCIKSKSKSIN